MNYFVNLPARYIAEEPTYLKLFLKEKLNPEIGLDAWAIDTLPDSWHKHIAQTFHDAGRTCAIHLPFFDLQPGSSDSHILQATETRLQSALHIAEYYKPQHYIGHAGFDPLLYKDSISEWLERAATTWKNVLGFIPSSSMVFLENVKESEPDILQELLEMLDSSQTGFCFDVGHWFSFGEGKQKNNLKHWIETLGPYTCHVHLHDNTGENDSHLGMGEGMIPWHECFQRMAAYQQTKTVTLEPHTLKDFNVSQQYVKKHAAMLEELGLTL